MPLQFSVKTLIDHACARLRRARLGFGQGIPGPWDEAAYYVLHALHRFPDELPSLIDEPVSSAVTRKVMALVGRRVKSRVPAAYLTHEAWLGDFRFYVDERVVIPRSFIAEALHEGLAPYLPDPVAVRSALDLCTGSGCLAVLLAHAYPEADIDAVDLSPDALAVAQRNVSDYALAGRINLIRSDLFDNVPPKSYDLVISNPPYVTTVAMEELPPEYRHEPALALAGGDDGLDAVHTILRKAPQFMERDGVLVVEIGHGRAAIEAAYPRMPFVWLATASSDSAVFLLRRDEIVAGR